ncbi:hypothetical protein CLG94_12330 [Candidatus Methylomirabilis limnetica]|jgi:hypothetical protein|uniref:Uncharacterized protein n=1 Tax=Candidatus Methylomirabilis limnetica TaxID=2033718 RepID=A0A2T4TV60_9BACT|nr:hypothetical protein [Candidatus Methylomirabilis limnetica]PTL35000.1 hypothetical protein CLG94_12330 [Candidatus Methylomirabilis limnetica]
MKVALLKEPMRIPVTDPDSLMDHSKIMMLRAKCQTMTDIALEKSQRLADHAEFMAKKAKLALEHVELELEQLEKQEHDAITDFFQKVRSTHPVLKTLRERYGKGVSFIFDSDNKDVWIMALFNSDAPPILSDDDFPGTPFEEDDAGDDDDHGDEKVRGLDSDTDASA